MCPTKLTSAAVYRPKHTFGPIEELKGAGMTPNGLPDPQLTRLPTGDIMYTLHMPIGTTAHQEGRLTTGHCTCVVLRLGFLLTLCFTALQEKYVASKLTLILALRPVAFPERSFSTLSGTRQLDMRY